MTMLRKNLPKNPAINLLAHAHHQHLMFVTHMHLLLVIFLFIVIIGVICIEMLYSVCTYTQFLQIKYVVFGLAVEHQTCGRVDMGSSFIDRNKNISLFLVTIIWVIVIIVIIVQVNALLETLELTNSARRKGHFALYN